MQAKPNDEHVIKQLHNALRVFTLSTQIHDFLVEHDPMALRQAEQALALVDGVEDCIVCFGAGWVEEVVSSAPRRCIVCNKFETNEAAIQAAKGL